MENDAKRRVRVSLRMVEERIYVVVGNEAGMSIGWGMKLVCSKVRGEGEAAIGCSQVGE